ncbi:helix-turn-helix domain-containing protein [Aquitalea magnusonii]|uniref:XRE family transcriptional regulator n=1 Tax=Aquitalea magnusonii TaxID=332411 RepID=A0A318JD11_9NEIS|nr:helix-turn-helix domain-containing protein [Aquitalea magnusonii]PXX46278.1 XRE family transcriptional regulator [Aquitalea magnusonii]
MSNGSLEVMQNVSANLRQARQQQGYSQERLAERAGISRRMLVNIEAGESNASIATVDKLASALGLSFAEVVRPPPLADKGPGLPLRIWQGERADSHASLLESLAMPGMTMELWRWQLAAGDSYLAEADAPGCQELLYVLAGQLQLQLPLQQQTHVLQAGQSLAFALDQPCSYHNLGAEPCTFTKSVLMVPHQDQ